MKLKISYALFIALYIALLWIVPIIGDESNGWTSTWWPNVLAMHGVLVGVGIIVWAGTIIVSSWIDN